MEYAYVNMDRQVLRSCLLRKRYVSMNQATVNSEPPTKVTPFNEWRITEHS
jgi:hypothetical protein